MTRMKWLAAAEIMDALRLMPRGMILLFTVLYGLLTYQVWIWFEAEDFTQYTDTTVAALMAFPATFLTALGGILMKIFLEYMRSGRSWTGETQEQRETPRCPSCERAYPEE